MTILPKCYNNGSNSNKKYMAKKKKPVRKKKAQVDVEPSPFWGQAGAVLLILAAALLLIGGFGTGGALPINLFHGVYWTFGWAAYVAPVTLVAWGVYKFKAEDHKIPLGKPPFLAT